MTEPSTWWIILGLTVWFFALIGLWATARKIYRGLQAIRDRYL